MPDKGAPSLRPEELRKGAEEDLRTRRFERLDVVQLRHMPAAGVPFMESLDAVLAMQAEGKIRHLALSNLGVREVELTYPFGHVRRRRDDRRRRSQPDAGGRR